MIQSIQYGLGTLQKKFLFKNPILENLGHVIF